MAGESKKRSPYDIRTIFEELTLGLIASLRRNLQRHRDEEREEGFRWEMWQKAKLRALVGMQRINRKLVRDALREAEQLTGDVLRSSFDEGVERTQAQGERAVERVASGEIVVPEDIRAKLPPPEPTKPAYEDLPHAGREDHFHGLNDKKLNALQESAKKDIRSAGGSVLRKMDDVYRQTIFAAEAYMAAGAKTMEQAVDMATKSFLERGIDSITYADGRRINISSYAEMALRTASQRATFLGEGKKRDEWGIHTVVISSHANCSEMCLPWQGRVFIDDVYSGGTAADGDYPLLSTAIKAGLFHPNCRHTMATYFPGVSQLPKPVDEKVASANYDAEQRQRYMERTIRKYKRLEVGSLDEGNRVKYGAKVKEWQAALGDHLDANDHLRRDRRREQVKPGERNSASDARQYERYKRMLGDRAPASLEEFQRIKYTDGERWAEQKSEYRKLSNYEAIAAREPQITSDLQTVARETGVDMVGLDYRLKSKDSYLRKVNSDSKGSRDMAIINDTLNGTNDVIRYTYQADGDSLVDRFSAVSDAMMAKGYSRFKLKNTWNDKRNPYKGINGIFVSLDGQKFEVQFHTPESFELKNGPMHKLYEEYRLDGTSPERRAAISKEMFELSAALRKPKGIDTIK